jgi:hypothetical protein
MYNRRKVSRRSSSSGFLRQSVPAIGLSLERQTARVPADGFFYVLLGEEVKGRFRIRADAERLYQALLAESGYKPKPEPSSRKNESVENYLDELESYWTSSHRFQKRGGKGRY